MNTFTVPVLFTIIGVIVYAVTNNKASTLGLYMYFCGLFWFTWAFVSHTVHLP